ncbi:Uncharacterised protein [Mycoplasmopsis arginini]|nr:Uncharacterised protein [Mycoplasmopsis arginini]SGA30458.1 Uncharacterised protein [Chlamydia abortus]SGA30546.1 Uncharacterised protein [Mycoplasmopsis arginini]SGA30750.1 Uncharacterised protein [Chlamydia abortus]
MMKLRLTPRILPNFTDHHRPVLSNTLLTRHLFCLLFNRTYHPRRKPRLNHSLPPRQRRLHIFHLPLPTRRPRPLLWLIPSPKNLKHWHYTSIPNYSNSLYRLRTPMGPNIILGGNSNHKPIISNPIHRDRPRPVNLRRILHW